MDKATGAMLNRINSGIERIAISNERILAELVKPKSKLQKTVDFLLAAVGIGGGITIVEQIIQWIRG